MAEQPLSAWQVAEAAGAWRTAGGDLPDLNVWLALSHTGHPFYAQATAYWEQACAEQTRLWFCRTTMLGLVRLLAQPRVMDRAVLALPQALAVYHSWLDVPLVGLLPDPLGADQQLEALVGTQAAPLPARLWTDAWLAATAEAAGLRLVTFDADFERLGLSRLLVLQR